MNPEKIAALEVEISHLKNSVERLTEKVELLTEVMNRGKGAFGFAVIVVGTFAALLSKIFDKLMA